MNEKNIVKGISVLKELAMNIRSFMDYNYNKYENNIKTLTFLDEMNHCCSTLTEIFENEFTNMIEEKERIEDDGK